MNFLNFLSHIDFLAKHQAFFCKVLVRKDRAGCPSQYTEYWQVIRNKMNFLNFLSYVKITIKKSSFRTSFNFEIPKALLGKDRAGYELQEKFFAILLTWNLQSFAKKRPCGLCFLFFFSFQIFRSNIWERQLNINCKN